MNSTIILGIIKSIDYNLDKIYIDKAGFTNNNSNLYMCRKNEELILGSHKGDIKKRINLILAINKNEILLCQYYKNDTIGAN